ncbi:MAG: hypothetical protein LAO51_06000 [Acidobacteriia bacterium]|nr:hypothetical protein [Terriglobia bacterium]
MANKPKTRLEGRDAGTGKFKTVEEARKNPRTMVVERVPVPGRGDTGRGKKKGR